MNNEDIIKQIDHFINQLTLIAENSDYALLKYKVFRNQPPKKLDVKIEHPMYKGTTIKIRNIVNANGHVTFHSDVLICFFGHTWMTLTDAQEKAINQFVYKFSQHVITEKYLSI